MNKLKMVPILLLMTLFNQKVFGAPIINITLEHVKSSKDANLFALSSDALEFYQSGTLSEALSKSVLSLQLKNENLSESEAVDLLVKSTNE